MQIGVQAEPGSNPQMFGVHVACMEPENAANAVCVQRSRDISATIRCGTDLGVLRQKVSRVVTSPRQRNRGDISGTTD